VNESATPSNPPRTVAVVCTQRIGDVLLATALVRSIKRQWPDAEIDMIVYRGTEGVLEHNPDLRNVVTVARRASWRERLASAARLWRRYDIACATLASSRCRFYAWAAGRWRVGLFDPDRPKRATRFLLHRLAPDEHRRVHTVTSYLALAPVLGVAPVGEVVAPGIGDDPTRRAAFDARLAAGRGTPPRPLVVVHPYPMFAYKQWHAQGWLQLIDWLRAQGFVVALSGGPASAELEYARRIAESAREPVMNFVGQLSLGETAEMIRRAVLFVGPDTGVTHIAAACGTPTVALFGPSNPCRWGPWPRGWPAGNEPWPLRGSGRRGNVFLLQGEGDCVPCKAEGCERHLASESRCLTELDAKRVIDAAKVMLGLPTASAAGDTQPLVRLPVERG